MNKNLTMFDWYNFFGCIMFMIKGLLRLSIFFSLARSVYFLSFAYSRSGHREQRSPIWPYFKLKLPYNCSANRSVVDSNRCEWSDCKHAIVLHVGWNPIRSNDRRPKGDDSGKRSFPYETRSAESKKRDKGWNLPPRDSLDVDRSIPVTETEVEFCELWSVPRECEVNRF